MVGGGGVGAGGWGGVMVASGEEVTLVTLGALCDISLL